MGKLEDLRDDPQPQPAFPAAAQPPDESVTKLIARVKGLLVGDDYLWAEQTLRGILHTLETTQRCTTRQVESIDHIADKPYNEGSRSRRRSGW